jgi:hypothetical protein
MALFSDVDWVILLAAAGFLLFGKEAGSTLRTLGRWYGRAGQLKQELLAEFSKAAEIPIPTGGARSIRGALLGLDPTPTQASGIPAAVTVAPGARSAAVEPSVAPWPGTMPTPTWSMTVPAAATSGEVWSR